MDRIFQVTQSDAVKFLPKRDNPNVIWTGFDKTDADDNNDITVAGATFEKTTAGAENPAAWSSWASGNWYAITIAVRPASGGGGWANIAEIDTVTAETISEIDTIISAEIAEINSVPV